MLSFIHNLYYRFYKFIISVGEKTIPRYNAVLLLSILSILNFITGIVLAIILTKKIIIVDLPKFYLFIIGLVIIGINSYIVFGNKRYLAIEEKYKNEDRQAKAKNNLKAVVYVVLTVLLLGVSLIYLNNNPVSSIR